jgi:hypothetical protein
MWSMPNTSSARVVPKNLFLSAQRALSEPAIHLKSVTQSNIRDLCTLITLSVLYDAVETLGSKTELDTNNKPYIAQEYQSIRDFTGLEITIGPSPSEFEETLRQSISFATRPFAAAGKNVALEELKNKLSNSLRLETSGGPDYWEDFAEGQRLVLTKDLKDQSIEPENFWLRSFLYAGLASIRKRPLVPDAIRTWGIDQASACPSDYGQRLEEVIKGKYSPRKMRELIVDHPFQVPPFAAAVFLRAGSDRRRIPGELKALRDELASVRSALSGFQRERDTADYRGFLSVFGKPHTEDSVIALDDRVHYALESLRKVKVPVPPQFFVLKPVFEMVKSAASLFTNLVSPFPRIVAASRDLVDLASKVTEVESSGDNSALVEVHYRLGWTLRDWFNSGIRLEELFGPIQDDEPYRHST